MPVAFSTFHALAALSLLGPEVRFLQDLSPDTVRTEAEIQGRLAAFGFEHLRRGTFESKTLTCYFYAKAMHTAPDPAQAREMLVTARRLTGAGVLFPGTQWGALQSADGNFQLFAVTRALETIRELRNTPGRVPQGDNLLDDWIRRVPPGLQRLMNIGEAMHLPNWGWSTELGRWYPIDVEVIDFS